MIFPGASNANDMVQSGLLARAGWLFDGLASNAERLLYLGITYPNVPQHALIEGLLLAQDAWQAAKQVQAGFDRPPDTQIPVNSTIDVPGDYEVDIVIKGPDINDPDRTVPIPMVVRIPGDTNPEDFLEAINLAALEEIERGAPSSPVPGPDSGTIDIDSGSYTIIIKALTRG